MKSELLKAIDKKIDELNHKDIAGIAYWNSFKKFIEDFKPKQKGVEERKLDFIELMKPYQTKYSKALLNDFYSYWTEISANGKKMRFEKEKVFDVGRRLGTWFRNQKSAPGENNSIETL